jgi:hypothetical protein
MGRPCRTAGAVMTKVTIEIEDVTDKKACKLAIRKLYTTFIDHYGREEADQIWFLQNRDLNAAREKAYWHPRLTLSRALAALPSMEPGDKRLVLEYYAMEKPSKEGLAKELARRNVSLNNETNEWDAAWHLCAAQNKEPPWPLGQRPPAPYGPTGTTSWQTMLQQIKRVFRKHKEACAAIGAAPPELREDELRRAGVWSSAVRAPRRGTK